jgi:MFS family permease
LLSGILFCCSLIPTAVSTAVTPQPLQDVTLDLRGLFANSPVAFMACLLIGVANGAWGTLGPVYGARIDISTPQIALMMSLVVIAGAATQMPAGRLSDRVDRRYVLAGGGFLAALVGVLLFFVEARSGSAVIGLTACYGAMAYILYSLAVAHANDHADASSFVKISGGLLLLYGFGTMIGPLLGSFLMARMRPEALFLSTALPHFLLGCYTMLRVSQRAAVLPENKEAFNALPSERAVTPQAVLLDPRGPDDPETPAEEDAETQLEFAGFSEDGRT